MGHSRTLRDRWVLKVCGNASQPRSDKKCSLEHSPPGVILSDALKTVWDRQNAQQSVLENLCFKTGIVLPLCISLITCTTVRPCLGLQPNQYFNIMSLWSSDKVKLSGLAGLCCGLKKDTAWEIISMHPENSIVHETRSMPVC